MTSLRSSSHRFAIFTALTSLGALGSAGCFGDDSTEEPAADAATDQASAAADAGQGDAAHDAGPCAPVTFRATATGGGDGGFWFQTSDSNPGDGAWWYSISKPDGGGVPIFIFDDDALTICGPPATGYPACQSYGGAVGGGCGNAPDGGEVAVWDGVVIRGPSTCIQSSGEAPMGCTAVACATPGQYVVTMCGIADDCQGATTCVKVPFDYPTASDVVGHIGE